MAQTAQNKSTSNSIWQKIFDRFISIAPSLIIFVSVFTVATLKNIYDTNVNAEQVGLKAVNKLESYIDKTANNLSELKKEVDGKCEEIDIQHLRQYVFNSPIAKEVRLFDTEGQIYCSNNQGQAYRYVNSNVIDRIQHNDELNTISLVSSAVHHQAILIYSANDDLSGISVLLPPEQFLSLITPELEKPHYNYQVKVLNQTLAQQNQSNTSYQTFNFVSDTYPVTITLQLTNHSYWSFWMQNFWKIVFWATIATATYQAVRNYRLSRNSLAFLLKEAIHNDELELFFQPIIDIETPKIIGSESLMRWNNPDHGTISPTIFIPLAERIQVIEQVTYQAFKLVTKFINKNKDLLKDQYISVNISRTLIIDAKFIEFLRKYAQINTHILPLLLLEITEDNDFSADELAMVKKHLTLLKELGYRIAMDDFGTGYSGLNFIHQHNFDIIKIDQVFIKGLSQDSAIHSVLSSMVKLAQQLEMRVIAEGVETQDQAEELRALGVRYIQGYYYSQPLPEEDYLTKLSEQSKTK